MSAALIIQWIVVGLVVGLAVVLFVRKLRKNPCDGCSLAAHCSRRQAKCCGDAGSCTCREKRRN